MSCPWGTPTQAQIDQFWAMGDVNRDGVINQIDIDLINAAYGTANLDYDFTGPDGIPDGIVDMYELSVCGYYQGYTICEFFAPPPPLPPLDLTLILVLGGTILGGAILAFYLMKKR